MAIVFFCCCSNSTLLYTPKRVLKYWGPDYSVFICRYNPDCFFFSLIFCTAFAPLLLSRCVPQKPETTEIHVKTERKTNRNISPSANTFMATTTKSLITFSHLFEALFSFSGCNPLRLWHAYYFVHHSTELPVFLSSHQREPLSLLRSLSSP